MTVDEGLEKLIGLLPLKSRQDALDPSLAQLHRDILRSFADNGRALTRAQLAGQLGADKVDETLQRLAADDLVVLSDDLRELTGAYPFTSEKRKHQVNVNGQDVYAMCAVDAVAIAPMCQVSTRILSRCHVTDEPVEIQMNNDRVLSAVPADVHVGIRWQSTTGCAAKSLCLEMVYLKDAETAAAWQQEDPENVSTYTLAEAVEFGAAFFRPLLQE